MKVPSTELRDIKDPGLLDFIDFVSLILNDGRYQARVVTTIPNWTGGEGEVILYSAGTVQRIYYYLNGTWQFTTFTNSTTVATQIEVRTDDPSTPVAGQIWLRSDL